MESRQGNCQGFVKTMSFRERTCESTAFRRLAKNFGHYLPGDNQGRRQYLPARDPAQTRNLPEIAGSLNEISSLNSASEAKDSGP